MTYNPPEIIKAAINLEEKGYQFYLKAVKQAGSELARQIFQTLAVQEQEHKRYLESIDPGAEVPDALVKQSFTRLKGIFTDLSKRAEREAHAIDDDIAAARFALKLEEKSCSAYQKWAVDTESPEARDLCLLLADVEKVHVRMLEEALDYLLDPHAWLMDEEQFTLDALID